MVGEGEAAEEAVVVREGKEQVVGHEGENAEEEELGADAVVALVKASFVWWSQKWDCEVYETLLGRVVVY